MTNLCRAVEANIKNQLKTDKINFEPCPKIFNSVQTSFSSIDLVSTRKFCQCDRKIKSQENIHARCPQDISNELIEFIKEVYSDEVSTKFWSERIKKLMQKLAKPGGEEKIREKIRTFLKKAPRSLSDCDAEQKEFRERLPDNIINKLKKMYLKTEKIKKSSIRIYRIEIPTSNEKDNNRNELRKVIKNWLNTVPIKKKSLLNKLIKQIEPYIPITGHFNIDNKKPIIQHIVKNLLEEIPMQINSLSFLNQLASSLVDDLYQIKIEPSNQEIYDSDKCIKDNKFKTLKDFIACQLSYIFEKDNVFMDTNQSNLLQEKIINIFATNSKYNVNEHLREKIRNVFLNLVGLSDDQSKYFADKLIHNFKENFHDNDFSEVVEKEKCQTNAFSYSDAYSVFNNASLSNIKNQCVPKYENNYNEIRVSFYKQEIIQQIEAWLKESSLQIPLFPDKRSEDQAIKDLAEDIVDRFKYLNMNPGSSYENELQYLKYQIFKWINKVIGEDNLQTIERAPELMQRIQKISTSTLVENENSQNLRKLFFQQSSCLNEKIIKWLAENLENSNDFNFRLAKELVNRIQECIFQNMSVEDIIENEVETWVKTACNSNLKKKSLDKLKFTLKSILQQHNFLPKFDPKQDRMLIRMYEDIIDDWLDTYLFNNNVELFYNRHRNEFIHDLAVTLLNTQYLNEELLEKDIITAMKEIISEWSTKILIYTNLDVKLNDHCILKLVHAIQSCVYGYEKDIFQNHANCSQIVCTLKNWLNTLLLYEHINENEKERLVEVICNLVNRLSISKAESIEILKIMRGILNLKQDDEIVQENANNFQTYLRELNLYTEELNNTEFNDQSDLIPANHISGSAMTKLTASKFTVYGLTLSNNKEEADNKAEHLQDTSVKPINKSEIEADHVLYAKQLVKEIDNWLNGLNVPQIHDKGFREIVVNDLAGDIIDRQRYLALNNSSKRTDDGEMNQLRYQIFKWINKLVGETHQQTLQHASDLMNRIKSIPVPIFAKHNENNNLSSSLCSPCKLNVENVALSNNQQKNNNINSIRNNTGNANGTNIRLSSPLGFTTGPMATNSKQNVNPLSIFGTKGPGSHLKHHNESIQNKQDSGSTVVGTGTSNKDEQYNNGLGVLVNKTTQNENKTNSLETPETSLNFNQHNTIVEELESLPQGMSLQELYDHFAQIFKNKIQELPLEFATPDEERLANLARTAIYNGIWKTFYSFLDDPDIANDYCLFDLLFEERLDNMLDCLPQTNEMQNIRQGWKSELLNGLLLMLKYVHSITDKPNIREIIVNRVNRQIMRNILVSNSDKAQHCFVARTADGYILSTRYKEDDPIRANIYRHRLMKRLEELAENVKYQNKIEFYEINPSQLCQLAFKILGDVPIPDKEELKEEAEEILLGMEIEEWYKDLPVKPVLNEDNAHLRRRLREILAKRLRNLEKKIDALGDPSLEFERDMKHEISEYLEKDAELKQVNDLNINYMVEELTKRIKNRHENNMLGYETFVKENPASSTFIQKDPGDIMAPLVNVQQNLNKSGNNDFSLAHQDKKRREHASSLPNNSIQRAGPIGGLSFSNGEPTSSCQRQCNLGGKTSSAQEYANANNKIFLAPVPQSTPRRESTSSPVSEEVGRSRSEPKDQRVLTNDVVSCAPQQNVSDQMQFLTPGVFIQSQSDHPLSTRVATGSTARLVSGAGLSKPQVAIDEALNNNRNQEKYKCHCMERLPMCSGRHYCDDLPRYPFCHFPVPFPGYFY